MGFALCAIKISCPFQQHKLTVSVKESPDDNS